jgi:hypothetical protein
MATYVKKFLQELLVDDESDIGTLVQKALPTRGSKWMSAAIRSKSQAATKLESMS